MPTPKINLDSSTNMDLTRNGYDYEVSTLNRSDITIGKVSRDRLNDLVRITFSTDEEKTVKTRRLHAYSRSGNLDHSGLELPFYLETGAFKETTFFALKDKTTNDTLHASNLWANEYEIVTIDDKYYFIANAFVDHTLDVVLPYDTSYVQFLIGELKPEKEY